MGSVPIQGGSTAPFPGVPTLELGRPGWLPLFIGVRDLLLACLLAAPLLFLGQAHEYWLTDEPFVAEVAREMLVSRNYVVPTLNGKPFLEKPPLSYAAIALSWKLCGQFPWAARLPSALFGMVSVAATYLLGRRLFGRSVALWSALILPTLFLPFYLAHYALADPALEAFVAASLAAFAYASGEQGSPWALLLAYLFAALAFLSKGPVGPLMIVLGALPQAAEEKGGPLRRPWLHVVGAALFLGGVMPWITELWLQGGWLYLREAFLANTLGRFLAIPSLVPKNDALSTHAAPVYDYLGGLLGQSLPWAPLLILAVLRAAGRWIPTSRKGGAPGCRYDKEGPRWGERFLLIFLGANLLLLSLARTKRSMYLAPLFPALAVIMAKEWLDLESRRGQAPFWVRWMTGLQLAVTGAFAVTVVLAFLYLSGLSVIPPRGFMLWGMCLAIASAMAGWSLRNFRTWRRQRYGPLLKALWGQAAASYLLLILLCFGPLDAQKSLAGFFREAAVVERARNSVPCLLLDNESYIGMAGLYFNRTLPAGGPSSNELGGRQPEDVITDKAGLEVLNHLRRFTPKIICGSTIGGPGVPRSLFLIHLKPASGRGPQPREAASLPDGSAFRTGAGGSSAPASPPIERAEVQERRVARP
jgi:4-amino-4-deoxy-L-arabinose transferase-like glycosyltransferase